MPAAAHSAAGQVRAALNAAAEPSFPATPHADSAGDWFRRDNFKAHDATPPKRTDISAAVELDGGQTRRLLQCSVGSVEELTAALMLRFGLNGQIAEILFFHAASDDFLLLEYASWAAFLAQDRKKIQVTVTETPAASPLVQQSGTRCYGRTLLSKIWCMMRISSLKHWSLLPADHSEEYKLKLIRSKCGPTLRQHLLSVCEIWIIAESLLLSCFISAFSLLPESMSEAAEGEFEVEPSDVWANPHPQGVHVVIVNLMFCIGSVILSISVVMWGVIYINAGATHPDNMHAFALASLSSLQACEYLLLLSFYSLIGTYNYVAYVRMHTAMPGSELPLLVISYAAVPQLLLMGYMMFHVNWTSLIVFRAGLGSDSESIKLAHSVSTSSAVESVIRATKRPPAKDTDGGAQVQQLGRGRAESPDVYRVGVPAFV